MKLPAITREVHEVTAERDLHDVTKYGDDPTRPVYEGGDVRYQARTTGGDWLDITRDEFERLSAALGGNGDDG